MKPQFFLSLPSRPKKKLRILFCPFLDSIGGQNILRNIPSFCVFPFPSDYFQSLMNSKGMSADISAAKLLLVILKCLSFKAN